MQNYVIDIIVASHGDNTTPPQQALGWIDDTYKDVEEIKARGQRILYTLHDKVGHLGIFVPSSIAKKQHKEIVSTVKATEALAPGLHEMVIEDEKGEGVDKQFTVAFREHSIPQVMAHNAAETTAIARSRPSPATPSSVPSFMN